MNRQELREKILDTVAANLVEFGYPDANRDNVTTAPILAAFGQKMVREFAEKHADNADVQAVCQQIVDEMDAAESGICD